MLFVVGVAGVAGDCFVLLFLLFLFLVVAGHEAWPVCDGRWKGTDCAVTIKTQNKRAFR